MCSGRRRGVVALGRAWGGPGCYCRLLLSLLLPQPLWAAAHPADSNRLSLSGAPRGPLAGRCEWRDGGG